MRRKQGGHPARLAWLVVGGLLAFMVAFAAGCGGDDDSDSATTASEEDVPTEVGKGEGELNLVGWAGYVEDGSTDPKVDWVTDFEKETGCQVNFKVGGTSDEMVELMRSGDYDGVSASGNATARLVASDLVAPVNVDLVPNYATVFDDLKDQPYNTFDGVNYGIPHGRGANVLMWNSDEAPEIDGSTWAPLLDPNEASKYSGKISVYDDPIYIADAAVYLKAHQPDLGIDNPYELDEDQFNAAVDLLKQQKPDVGEYWSDALKQISAFEGGDDVVGTTWQYQYFALQAEDEPVATTPASQGFLPSEGATGWSDTWMISSQAEHPNCMYMWMDHIISPEANAKVAAWFGEAPAQSESCAEFKNLDPAYFGAPNHCKLYNADNPEFWSKVYYWETPLADCGDDRGEACKDYNEWVSAWTEIKG
jgi:putative spermidine/putrescine transport system substrate-binding protein